VLTTGWDVSCTWEGFGVGGSFGGGGDGDGDGDGIWWGGRIKKGVVYFDVGLMYKFDT